MGPAKSASLSAPPVLDGGPMALPAPADEHSVPAPLVELSRLVMLGMRRSSKPGIAALPRMLILFVRSRRPVVLDPIPPALAELPATLGAGLGMPTLEVALGVGGKGEKASQLLRLDMDPFDNLVKLLTGEPTGSACSRSS